MKLKLCSLQIQPSFRFYQDLEHVILLKYYLYGAPETKDIFKKTVESENLGNLKLKSRDMVQETQYLESTIYMVDNAKSNIFSFLTEQEKFLEERNIRQ